MAALTIDDQVSMNGSLASKTMLMNVWPKLVDWLRNPRLLALHKAALFAFCSERHVCLAYVAQFLSMDEDFTRSTQGKEIYVNDMSYERAVYCIHSLCCFLPLTEYCLLCVCVALVL